MTYLVFFLLGIFLGAFIASGNFRTKCVNIVRKFIQWAQKEAQKEGK